MLARNKEYLQLAVDYAQAVVISAELLKPFPDWMKWYENQVWSCFGAVNPFYSGELADWNSHIGYSLKPCPSPHVVAAQ